MVNQKIDKKYYIMWIVMITSFILFCGLGYFCCQSTKYLYRNFVPKKLTDTNYVLDISNSVTHQVEKVCFLKEGTQHLELVQCSNLENGVINYWRKTH